MAVEIEMDGFIDIDLSSSGKVLPQKNDKIALIDADTIVFGACTVKEFVEAVKETGRKKLIMTALWTEACLTFPVLDALKEGYEVYIVVDAVGGTSKEAHDAAIRRMEQAGAISISVAQLFCELQRDWNRAETQQGFMELFINTGGTAGIQFGYDKTE